MLQRLFWKPPGNRLPPPGPIRTVLPGADLSYWINDYMPLTSSYERPTSFCSYGFHNPLNLSLTDTSTLPLPHTHIQLISMHRALYNKMPLPSVLFC